MLAGAIRRHIYLSWDPFKIYPNLYIVLVGPPGLGKGVAIEYGHRLLRHVPGANLGANKTSPEALIHMLSGGTFDVEKKKPKNDEERKKMKAEREARLLTLESTGTLIAPEFSVLVGRDAQKNGMLSILSDWYDCPVEWKNTTISTGRGVEILRNICLTIIGGTTPDIMSLSFPQEAIGGGLSSRNLYVSQSCRRFLNPFPHWDAQQRALEQALIQDLVHISNLKGEMIFDPDAKVWFGEWYTTYDRKALDDRFWGYLERKPIHLLKLAELLSISQSDDMIVTTAHLQVALSLLDKIEARMPESFNSVGPTARDVERVGQQLLNNNNQMNFQELVRANLRYCSKRDLEGIILPTMLTAGLIEDKQVTPGASGRIIRLLIGPPKRGGGWGGGGSQGPSAHQQP